MFKLTKFIVLSLIITFGLVYILWSPLAPINLTSFFSTCENNVCVLEDTQFVILSIITITLWLIIIFRLKKRIFPRTDKANHSLIKKLFRRIAEIQVKHALLFFLAIGIIYFTLYSNHPNLLATTLGINKISPTPIPTAEPTLMPTDTPIPTLAPTSVPTSQKIQNQEPPVSIKQVDWGCEVIADKTTACAHPADERMSTPDELFNAVNSYRQAHGLSLLEKNETLCRIAQSRANEQLTNGKLDGHAGFAKYANDQAEFDNMAELLYGGVQNQLGVHIVEWGWARSQTGHKQSMENPKWQNGCGGIAGLFAVFVLGKR